MLSGAGKNLTSYGDTGFSRYLRGAFLAGAGFDADDLSRPVVGIADLTSDYNPCHRLMPGLVENVKRGVTEGGGVPFVFPTISLGEAFTHPTSMLFRNLLAIDTEELIRAQPMDAVVLLGGCDKTVPAQLMAAAVTDIPVIIDVVGPMLAGSWRGERLGACTDCRRFWARHRAGELGAEEIAEVESELVTTAGTCMVMGTASTMACLTETLGLMLPGGASPPAPSGARLRHATASGRRAVGAGWRPDHLARDPHAGRLRERAAGARGARRVDQRGRAPAGGGPTSRRRPATRRFRPHRPHRARCWSTSSPPGWATCRTSTTPGASRLCSRR